MKRITLYFFTASMLIGGLTSCSNNETSEPSSQPAKEEVTQPAQQAKPEGYREISDEERAARAARKEQLARESQEARENNPTLKEEYNITSTYRYIVTAPEFSQFAKLVKGSDVAKQMHNTQITLFAPDDNAMKDVDQGIYHQLLDPRNKTALNRFIMNHMCDRIVDSKTILEGKELMDFNHEKFQIDTENGTKVNGVLCTGTDIRTKAGIIMVVDGPIDYPAQL